MSNHNFEHNPVFNRSADDLLSKIKHYLPVIGVFIFLVGMVVYQVLKKGQYLELMNSTEINGIVEDVYEERSYLYIRFADRKNRVEVRDSYNYSYMGSALKLSSLIQEGDTIVKHKCSDTLFVKRNNEIYEYLIGDVLYNNKARSSQDILLYRSRRKIVTTNNDCQ